MARKRERLEIIRDILRIIADKKTIGPTRLLQSSNLSPQMFKDYMDSLQKKDLVQLEVEKTKKHFTLTGKGLRFLEDYRVIERFVESFGL